ncbi:MAG: glycine--tRNA ligase subunit beta, partial [Chthonomonadales bacterium]
MPDLLLEVGTEEMPAGAIESALSQLKSAIELGLTAARVPADCVSVCGTPRRLIVTATELPARQPDLSTQVKGPSKSVAFDASGNPTGAAIGFAKKQGIAVEDLTILSTDQGDYVQALVHEVGLPAIEAVSPIITAALKGLSFPKVMRWGNGANRFVRPVRWIVCMIDGKVTDFEFGGVKAGSKSRGHRFLSPDEFELSTGSNFARELYSRHVMIDPEKRREAIVRQSNELAAELGGNIPWDEGLLDENVWLVEWPTAVLGSFDPEYLELPRPVLVTAMKKHQRYFPIEDAGGNLKPNFIAIRSGDDANLDIVRDGYERVLAARFNDAKYFYSQDLESSLPEMRSQLDRLVFQEKLGNYLQKSNRLLSLANFMATSAGVDVASASRTAELCKADLVSRMVIELPALQGVIGREYALKTESPDVADAILEHYLPRFPGDKLPATPVGRLLAIADRIDTLVGYVGIGILPTGSSDPFGLRRAAQGL